jgi:hypothetical protein
MIREMPKRVESGILEQIRKSNTTFRTKLTTVYVCRPTVPEVEIIPRDVGEDTEGWSVGPEKIPVSTLEEAITLGMEIQARECPR